MATQVHALRHLMTTALLTAGAMVDGVLPPDTRNLRELVHTLDDVSDLSATVPKCDLDPTAGDDLVDVNAMIRSVVDDLALMSSATDVEVRVAAADTADSGCRALRGFRHDCAAGATRSACCWGER